MVLVVGKIETCEGGIDRRELMGKCRIGRDEDNRSHEKAKRGLNAEDNQVRKRCEIPFFLFDILLFTFKSLHPNARRQCDGEDSVHFVDLPGQLCQKGC